MDTSPVDIKGRSVTVRRLTETQVLMLLETAETMDRGMTLIRSIDSSSPAYKSTMTKVLSGTTRCMTILKSAIVEEDDKEYVDDLMMRGELDLRELVGIVRFVDVVTEEPQANGPAVVKRKPGRPAGSKNKPKS